MEITKTEARVLSQLVAAELRRGAKLMELDTVYQLRQLAEKERLAGWNRLFYLESRLQTESMNSNNKD